MYIHSLFSVCMSYVLSATPPLCNHLGGNMGLVLSVGIVVCRELHLSLTSCIVMQRAIPTLSPLVFMPSLFHNSKITTVPNIAT